MTIHPAADPMTSTTVASPAAELVTALLESGWRLTEDAAAPPCALRPADPLGPTLWITLEAGGYHLHLDAPRRRLADGTIRKPWQAEVFGPLPAEILTAVAAADTQACEPETEPGELLAPAGWTNSPHWRREWESPDGERELHYLDDDPDSAQTPWSLQRADLGTEICASETTPATVIAAFALTDAP